MPSQSDLEIELGISYGQIVKDFQSIESKFSEFAKGIKKASPFPLTEQDIKQMAKTHKVAISAMEKSEKNFTSTKDRIRLKELRVEELKNQKLLLQSKSRFSKQEQEYKTHIYKLNRASNTRFEKLKTENKLLLENTKYNNKIALDNTRNRYKAEIAEARKANKTIGAFGAGGTGGNTSFGHKVSTTAQYSAAGAAIYGVSEAMRTATEMSVQYDNALFNNMAVLKITRTESEKLLDSNRNIAVQYGITIQEMDEASIILGRAGVAYTNLAQATKITAQLAKITGDSLEDSSKVVSTFTMAFGLASNQVEELGNQLAYAANASRLSIEDLGTMGNYALSGAKALGLTKEAVLALATSFSNVGVNASTIGTQIRKIGKLFRDNDKHSRKFFDTIQISQERMMDTFASGNADAGFKMFVESVVSMSSEAYEAATSGMPILTKQMLDTLRLTGDNMIGHLDKIIDGGDNLAAQSAIQAMSIESMWTSAVASIGKSVGGLATDIVDLFSNNKRNLLIAYSEALKHLSVNSEQYSAILKEQNKLLGVKKEAVDPFSELPKGTDNLEAAVEKRKKIIDSLIEKLESVQNVEQSSWGSVNAERAAQITEITDAISEQKNRLLELQKALQAINTNKSIGLDSADIVSLETLESINKLQERIDRLWSTDKADKMEVLISKLSEVNLDGSLKAAEAKEAEMKIWIEIFTLQKQMDRESSTSRKAEIRDTERMLSISADIEAIKAQRGGGDGAVNRAKALVAQKERELVLQTNGIEALTVYKELQSSLLSLSKAQEAERNKITKGSREERSLREAILKNAERQAELDYQTSIGSTNWIQDIRTRLELEKEYSLEKIRQKELALVDKGESLTKDGAKPSEFKKLDTEFIDLQIEKQKVLNEYKNEVANREYEHELSMIELAEARNEIELQGVNNRFDGLESMVNTFTSITKSTNDFSNGLLNVSKTLNSIAQTEVKNAKAKETINKKYLSEEKKIQKQVKDGTLDEWKAQDRLWKNERNQQGELDNLTDTAAKDKIKGYGEIAGAMSTMFKEGSSGAQAMMQVQQALAIVEGGMAVVHQMTSGDVYTAIPRAMAVAAMVAQFVQGFNGGGTSSDYSRTIESANTTTVFGGGDEESTSISKSLSILEDYAQPENRLLTQMSKYLKSINENIKGSAADIIRTGEYSLGVGAVESQTSYKNNESNFETFGDVGMMIAGGVIGYGIDELLFDGAISHGIGKTLSAIGLGGGGYNWQKLQGSGIAFGDNQNVQNGSTFSSREGYYGGVNSQQSFTPQTLDDFINEFSGMLFQSAAYESMSKNFWGSASYSYSSSTSYKSVSDELSNSLSLTFKNIRDTLAVSSFILGRDIEDELGKLVVNLGSIDLKGLSGDKLIEKLENAFSAQSDIFTSTLYEDSLNGFQDIGEGLFETLTRVSIGISEATYYTDKLGVAFEKIAYTDIMNQHGDVGFEALAQSIIKTDEAIYGLNNGVVQMISSINASIDELYDYYLAFESMRVMIDATGQNSSDLSSSMLLGAGGVTEFEDALSSFIENFLTDEEQLALKTSILTKEFEKLNLSLPTSSDGFKDLISSIDTTDVVGQELYGRLILLSDGFAEISESTNGLYDDLKAFADNLLFTQLEATESLSYSVNMFNESIAGFSTASDKTSAAQSIINYANNALTFTKDSADSLADYRYRASSIGNTIQDLAIENNMSSAKIIGDKLQEQTDAIVAELQVIKENTDIIYVESA